MSANICIPGNPNFQGPPTIDSTPYTPPAQVGSFIADNPCVIQAYDKVNNATYYYNPQTGESVKAEGNTTGTYSGVPIVGGCESGKCGVNTGNYDTGSGPPGRDPGNLGDCSPWWNPPPPDICVDKPMFIAMEGSADLPVTKTNVSRSTIKSNGQHDTITGGCANDTIRGGFGNDSIMGIHGDDSMSGNDGNDTVEGGYGNDTVRGGRGDDKLYGGHGNDMIYGEEGNNTVYGGQGDDQISSDGFEGNLVAYGDEGNDLIVGAKGNDMLEGGDGNDTIWSGLGNDTVKGGNGNDMLRGAEGDDDLHGGTGNDDIIGYTGNDKDNGGEGNDKITGDEGDDVLTGGKGNDTMSGGTGKDTLDLSKDYNRGYDRQADKIIDYEKDERIKLGGVKVLKTVDFSDHVQLQLEGGHTLDVYGISKAADLTLL